MKKLNLTSFFSGIFFAVIVLSIFAFTNKNISETTRNLNFGSTAETINPATAVQYRNNYKAVYPGAIEAVNISVEQLDALNQTVRAMNNDLGEVSGFRLFYGATTSTSSAAVVSIPYVINKQLKQDAPAANIIVAEGFNKKYNLPCPSFCD